MFKWESLLRISDDLLKYLKYGIEEILFQVYGILEIEQIIEYGINIYALT